ncbi:type VI secretion system accessory protein TagJ [Arenibaculum pallidiluteum]|uniref:type VI secretion system accessory protein TagJ n=1 Tax=Arenibaculum pallidiluteum TaxID=2812559 RepID=UPI001A95823A|nr:type VI secretion system accessory protein TagJ [Arenibaculum pallidiluteum]
MTGAPHPDTDASALFRAGRLHDAVEVQTTLVRRHPGDVAARLLLAELLCFTGALERADALLDLIGHQDPSQALGLAPFRQALRGETARRQHHGEGRLPGFPVPPTPSMRHLLEAGVELRRGALPEAAAAASAAEAARPAARGSADGAAFDDFRDLDDLCGGTLEAITGAGEFVWIPVEAIRRIAFRPPRSLRDLCWRRAQVSLVDGEEGEVFLPVLYAGERPDDEALAIGHRSDWRELAPGLVRGVGQRCFLAGEEVRPIMSLSEVAFGGGT